MIEERALVLGLSEKDSSRVHVRTQRQSACDSCQLKNGCGQRAMEKLGGNRSLDFEVARTLPVKPGDVVMVAIPEQGLLTAAAMMYLFPLLTMIGLAALVKSGLGWSDPAAALSGLLGLAVGFLGARRYSIRHDQDERFAPRMTGVALHAQAQMACVPDET